MTYIPKYGLVLSGGGARAAYQAGVLKGISEILGKDFGEQPFPIITGVSAGAINASQLASGRGSFADQVEKLNDIWNGLSPEQVLRTDLRSLSSLGAGWIKDLSFGGMLGKSESTHLLDSSPLTKLLESNIDYEQIHKNILNKTLKGVAVTATSYSTGTSLTFIDSLDTSEWNRSSRIGLKVPLKVEHILASSAIPLMFKPVRIGKSYFGDGGIRSNTPFSPAIHLGAEKILSIGVRYYRSGDEVRELNQEVEMESITLSDIAGVMFNSVFLDAIEFDYERLKRINATLDLISDEVRANQPSRLKKIPVLLIQPSVDLGSIATSEFYRFPRMLRYLLQGIGASKERGADLLSYIAFDKAYTSKLIDIGLKDAMTKKTEIRNFFEME